MSLKAEIVKHLSKTETYPHPTRETIKVIETNVSYVFLTGPYAYKLKKTIKFGKVVDYSTLEKRYDACLKEIKLNKRLCPELYLEVVPINSDLRLSDEGEIVDYLVKMKELPQKALLSEQINDEEAVTEQTFIRIAEQIASFHNNNRVKSEFDVFENIRYKWYENFETTERYEGFPKDEKFKERVFAFLEKNKQYWKNREEKNELVDGHGDLILNNIFLHEGKICIFDCIEFSDMFRIQDPFEEVAFLAMDLEFNNKYEYSKAFLKKYLDLTQEPFEYNSPIIQFYKSYRAFVRAKVFYSLYLQNPASKHSQLLKERALNYLKLSKNYVF